MKVIYICGAYRNKDVYQVWNNIQLARVYAIEVWKMGHVALCPHTNSAFFEGAATSEQFLEGTKELLRRCDAVMVCPNFENSEGSKGEIELAGLLNIPVFYELEELNQWLMSISLI